MTPEVEGFLKHYDRLVTKRLPDGFPYPIRSRDWELYQVLGRVPTDNRNVRILEVGTPKALAEMMRCLRPGGRLLLTTDSHEQGIPFDGFDRFWTLPQLRELFAPYRDVSPERGPDYAEANWSYPGRVGIVLVFVELVKSRRWQWRRVFQRTMSPARGVDFGRG
jgi:hypothetical protein